MPLKHKMKLFSPHVFASLLLFCVVAAPLLAASAAESSSRAASFAEFDRRARADERLTVVFFGASLTWGANASDPQQTSYRANMARKFEAAYPNAHFSFYDAAIGGTDSRLGVFRLERDVLRRKPDLVFLDFSANDDVYSDEIEKHASYESLVRRIVLDAGAPVVQVIFPFKWNVKPGEMAKMKRRDAHLEISRAYNTAVGDAIALANARVEAKQTTPDLLWHIDGAHPGDDGYALFADAAWQGFQDGVQRKLVCRAPAQMLHAPTFMQNARVRISSLGPLPEGWKEGIPNRTSAWYDGLMSRWLDDEAIASKNAAPLKLKFQGSFVQLFGEESVKSGRYRVFIDGQPVLNPRPAKDAPPEEFSASSARMGGSKQHVNLLASGLAPGVWHTLEIEPILTADTEQELRLESICVAGAGAKVMR